MQAVHDKDGWWMPAFRLRDQTPRQTCCTLAPDLTFNTPFGLFPSTVRLILLAINANMCLEVCPWLEWFVHVGFRVCTSEIGQELCIIADRCTSVPGLAYHAAPAGWNIRMPLFRIHLLFQIDKRSSSPFPCVWVLLDVIVMPCWW